MVIVFIDDAQERHELAEKYLSDEHQLLRAYTYEDAIAILKTCPQPIGLLMIDHDLGFDDDCKELKSGNDIATFILNELDMKRMPAQAIVHSYNASGADRIASKLRSANISTRIIQFSGDMLKSLKIELTPQ